MFTRKRDEYWQGVLEAERTYWQGVVTELTNQLVLLKVEPQMAAIQAVPAEQAAGPSPYVSAFDDEALAQYEQERKKLEESTKEFVEQYAEVAE